MLLAVLVYVSQHSSSSVLISMHGLKGNHCSAAHWVLLRGHMQHTSLERCESMLAAFPSTHLKILYQTALQVA